MSKMFFCNECETLFQNPTKRLHTETGEGGIKIPLPEDTCPYCGSTDFKEGDLCGNCERELADEFHGLCARCQKELVKKFHTFWATLSEGEKEELDRLSEDSLYVI